MNRSKRLLSFVVLALGFVLVAPVLAFGVTLGSVPATASAGATFTVSGDVWDSGDVTVRAVHLSGAPGTLDFAAVVSDDGSTFAVEMALPVGGDWRISALQSGDESAFRVVSCDPGDYLITASMSKKNATYGSLPVLSALVTRGDGTPLANASVQLCAYGDDNEPIVVRTLRTSSTGRVKTSVSNSGSWVKNHRWFGTWSVSPLEWTLKVPANGEVGSVESSRLRTTIKWTLNVVTPDKVSGKVKLTKGHKYEFCFFSANEGFNPGFFILYSPTGARVLNFDVTKKYLTSAHKTFTARRSGTYRWKMTGTGRHSCILGLW